MSARDWQKLLHTRILSLLGVVALAIAAVVVVSQAGAQGGGRTMSGDLTAPPQLERAPWPTLVIPTGTETSTLYQDGSQVEIETDARWKLVCGSNPVGVTSEDLQRFADTHYAAMETGEIKVIDSGLRTSGINIIFNTDSSVPGDAEDALVLVEEYLETLFADPITVTINVSFQYMGDGGVIGATSSNYVSNVSYSTSRTGLIAGMDSDDSIQEWLPTGSSIPVRYNGSSDSVSSENQIDWTKAAYRATIGSTSGSAASMSYNTVFDFDYDPSNGISGGSMSFVDVAIHEVGHALGFTSGTDWGAYMTALDVYRFQRLDGSGDYNPDTYEEFQTTPRLVDYNNPNDQHISDLIDAEYRMSDGSPWQASHFREQSSPWIGLMDPAFSSGETHYPSYFSGADLNMFDAIGYDFPPCEVPQFIEEPSSQAACTGQTVDFHVAVDIEEPTFLWRKGTQELVDDGVHVFGATTDTLTLVDITTDDISTQYNCRVTNVDGCVATTPFVGLTVYYSAEIVEQPVDVTVPEGDPAPLNVEADGSNLSYQWRRDGVPLESGGRFYFTQAPDMAIYPAFVEDSGEYDCVISNSCSEVTTVTVTLTVVPESYPGDMNCDGVLDLKDINPFVLALSGGESAYYTAYPVCNYYNADISGDGLVDVHDINPFVTLLTSGYR